ncbi:MAG: serine hydrolase domain-containing protein [Planctomycetota bacterium]|jgi:CubicO group peptidase (beta-lactamase class C family)
MYRIAITCAGFMLLLFTAALAARANPEALPAGDWLAHGYTEAQRQILRDAFHSPIERGVIPGGSMLILHKGEVIFREGFGVAELGTDKPFTPDMVCRIASVTKPHSATVIAILAERGLLDLEDPVTKHLPKFATLKLRDGTPARAPTIAECLSHTAGFPPNTVLTAGKVTLNWENTLEGVINELAGMPLMAPPGTRYAYSRLGFMTAGRIAEIVTGKRFEQIMRVELITKVGAISTFEPTNAMLARMPAPYDGSGGTLKPHTGERFGKVINPGGGLYATLDGVARVLQLHLNRGEVNGERLLSTKTLDQMYLQRPATKNKPYGLGMNLVARPDGSTGRFWHIGAAGTYAMADLDRDLAVVIFTQVGRQNAGWRRQLLVKIDGVFGKP